MHITSIGYADDYPFGTNPGTGASYLVNNAGGYAIGVTTIAADGGTGTLVIGDKVKFAGHTTVYEVATALSAGSFTITSGLTASVADNATITRGPNWTLVTDFLADGLEPGIEEIVTADMGEGGAEMDGVQLSAAMKVIGSNYPTPGTRTWIRIIGEDNTGTSVKLVAGGAKGCRISRGSSQLPTLGSGENYAMVQISATGGSPGSIIETDRTA